MRRKTNPFNKLKKAISWIIGLPSFLITVGELQDLRYWWVQFVAVILLLAILYWNDWFEEQDEYYY